MVDLRRVQLVVVVAGRVRTVVRGDSPMAPVDPVGSAGGLMVVAPVLSAVVVVVAVEKVRIYVVVLAVLFCGRELWVDDDALMVESRLVMVVGGSRVHQERAHSTTDTKLLMKLAKSNYNNRNLNLNTITLINLCILSLTKATLKIIN